MDRHHYVWRKYLRSWATDEKIWCSRLQGEPFNPNLINIAQEKGFYGLKDISENEIVFLMRLVSLSDSDTLNKLNQRWIDIFQKILNMKKSIDICEEIEVKLIG